MANFILSEPMKQKTEALKILLMSVEKCVDVLAEYQVKTSVVVFVLDF